MKSTRTVNNLHKTKNETTRELKFTLSVSKNYCLPVSPVWFFSVLIFSFSPCTAAMANYHHCSHHGPRPQTRVGVCRHQSRHYGTSCGAAGTVGAARARTHFGARLGWRRRGWTGGVDVDVGVKHESEGGREEEDEKGVPRGAGVSAHGASAACRPSAL